MGKIIKRLARRILAGARRILAALTRHARRILAAPLPARSARTVRRTIAPAILHVIARWLIRAITWLAPAPFSARALAPCAPCTDAIPARTRAPFQPGTTPTATSAAAIEQPFDQDTMHEFEQKVDHQTATCLLK